MRHDFPGQLWTCDLGAARDFNLNLLHARNLPGIATEHRHVHTGGGNGGMQAVNLAWHLGADRIVLLGYDMQITDGQLHWHGQHVNKLGDPKPDLMRRWAVAAASVAGALIELGVDVVNCSRQSAAQGWPRRPLENVIHG